MPAGKFLDHHEQSIALHIVSFERRGAAQRNANSDAPRSPLAHSRHFQPAQRARRPRSVSSQYRKKLSSNSPIRFQHRAAIKRGRAAGEQGLSDTGKSSGGCPLAALLADAIACQKHAGGIEPVLAEEADLGGAHTRIGAAGDGAHQGVEPSRTGHGIVVQHCDIRRGGCLDAAVDGGSEADFVALSMMRVPAAPLRRTRPLPLLSITITSKSRLV